MKVVVKLILAGLILLLLQANLTFVLAQALDPHTAQPERPTVATHAGTVATGWFEVEAGGEFDRYDNQSQGVGMPITAKFGISPNVQFNIFGSVLQPSGTGGAHIGDLAFGFKWRLVDDLPLLGRFALLPSIKLPTGSTVAGAGTGTYDGSLLLISSNDLGFASLDVNIGYTHRSGNGTTIPRESTIWTFSFGGDAYDFIGWAAELFGYPGTSGPAGQKPIIATLLGPTFVVQSWLVFDCGVIVPIEGQQPYALYFGAVWNIGRFL